MKFRCFQVEIRCIFGVLRWEPGVFLVFLGGLGEVAAGARIIDIP